MSDLSKNKPVEEQALDMGQLIARRQNRKSFSIIFTSIGVFTFMVTAYLICSTNESDPELQARNDAEVNPEAYSFPMVAFATAFCLNFVTLVFERDSTKFQLALLACYISLLAGMTDFLMYKGISPLIRGVFGFAVNPLRLNMYLHTTPAMVYLISVLSDYSRLQVFFAMAADALIMGTAILAEVCPIKWIGVLLYLASFACFFYTINIMWKMFEAALRESRSNSERMNLNVLRVYAVGLWFLFPLMWGLHRMGWIPLGLEEWILCAGDFAGKAVFSCSLMVGNFLTIDQRRLIAMHIVEQGSRAKVIEELRQLVDQKEVFLSSMSHELRTPLNGIIGLTDAMIAGSCGSLTTQGSRNLSTIKASSMRLLSLVNDIMDAASAKKGKLTIKYERVNIRSVVDDVSCLCQPLTKRGVQLLTDVKPGLPHVLGDSGRIIQIFHNLIGNSCKFTSKGQIAVTCDVDKVSQMMKVMVTDTGCGIPANKYESIFEAFEQVDVATTRKYGGTGLGLNLVKQLVEAHGGTISVVSKMGVQTTFTFTLKLWDEKKGATKIESEQEKDKAELDKNLSDAKLPLSHGAGGGAASVGAPQGPSQARQGGASTSQPAGTSGALAAVDAGSPRAAAPAPLPLGGAALMQTKGPLNPAKLRRRDGGKPVILSVDDDPVGQCVISNLLTPAGYEVKSAMDGEEALKMLQEEGDLPDAILLDVVMPGMSGYEVCRKLRDMHPHSCIPVIMISAKSEEEEIVEGLLSGCNDYIVKPFGPQEILARLGMHLKLREKLHETHETNAWEMMAAVGDQLDTYKIKSFLDSESKTFSLPRSIITQIENSTSIVMSPPSYHHLSMVAISISNLDKLLKHLSPEELVSAVTSMFIYLDALLPSYNCYKLDTMSEKLMYVVAGLSGEPHQEHVVNAVHFAEELIKEARKISVPAINGHVELAIGIHTCAAQGVIIGTDHPVLHFPGALVDRATQLQATCPSNCIHVSQQLSNTYGDRTRFTPVESDKCERSYLMVTEDHEANLKLVPRLLDAYFASHPFGPINTSALRMRPVQMTLVTLTMNHPGLLINLMRVPGVAGAQAMTEAPSLTMAATERDDDSKAMDVASGGSSSKSSFAPHCSILLTKVQHEKEVLQQQLELVALEADRLQELVLSLESTIKEREMESKMVKEQAKKLEAECMHYQSLMARPDCRNANVHEIKSGGINPPQSPRHNSVPNEAPVSYRASVSFPVEIPAQLSSPSVDSLSQPNKAGIERGLERAENFSGYKASEHKPSWQTYSRTPGDAIVEPLARKAVEARRSMTAQRPSGPGFLHKLAAERGSSDRPSRAAPAEDANIGVLLTRIGLEDLVPRFEAENITPALLPLMSDAALQGLGVTSLGARLRIRLTTKANFVDGSDPGDTTKDI